MIHGRENLIAAYSGYGKNIVLEKGHGLAVHYDKERGVVTLEYQVHGKAIKTGAAYDNRFAFIVTINNRKIVRWRDYMDSRCMAGAHWQMKWHLPSREILAGAAKLLNRTIGTVPYFVGKNSRHSSTASAVFPSRRLAALSALTTDQT